ncbi:hypothetical protein RM50_04590 [Pseudarthrobacter phenanthrenivorans]|uniref:Uncharacterized protein n=2 Tax=Pseudarthrobacter phenanthrenivorans TaxID=361575 RepID=A0A0B4D5X5_PSEPS|nr:hypothetical protein RM50_04590 [Pseudarthrobacter phenanthrenivorans]
MRRTEPPVTAATDTIRLNFHSLTRMVLPRAICQTCWLNIVGVSTGSIERGAIVEVEHDCPHNVEPDLVLFHALEGLPQEDYWMMTDPWNDGAPA